MEIDIQPPSGQSWEQLPSEPDMWFLRFKRYLLLGASRSVYAAYCRDCRDAGKEPAAALPGSWGRRSKEFLWESRSAAWDKAHASAEESEWHQRRQQLREKEWQVSELLFQKAEAALRDLELVGRIQNIANALKIASELGRKSSELWDSDVNAAIALLLKFDYEVKDKKQLELDNIDEEL
jgi:hypothetical protein